VVAPEAVVKFMEDFPQTEIQKLRAGMWAELYKNGMSLNEAFALNREITKRYPITDEERREKTEYLKRIPEFVL
jgi:hypothetical protein